MLHIEVVTDPVIMNLGHPIDSVYVETYWLPTIGPSSLWMLRRLVTFDGTSIDTADLAQLIGLGHGTGAHSPVTRTLARLESFYLVKTVRRHDNDALVQVGSHLPPLRPRQLARLLPVLQAAHAIYQENHHAHVA